MNNKVTVISLILLCTAALASAAFVLRADGGMVFPKTPHGRFIQVPDIIHIGNTRSIRWILPESCSYVSYEVQEVGYKPDSGMLWGGGDASCTLTKNGYECQAETHPEMSGSDKQWRVQASAYECDGGDYFISNAVQAGAF